MKRTLGDKHAESVASHGVRKFRLGEGLPDVHEMREELEGYRDVLLGRVPAPIPGTGVDVLMECASAYHARALELHMLLLEGENDGIILRNSKAYKFRTGELRAFIDMAKGAAELGSRRITVWQTEVEMRWEQT